MGSQLPLLPGLDPLRPPAPALQWPAQVGSHLNRSAEASVAWCLGMRCLPGKVVSLLAADSIMAGVSGGAGHMGHVASCTDGPMLIRSTKARPGSTPAWLPPTPLPTLLSSLVGAL